MFFLFDTETNGLQNGDYPGIIQIAWMILDKDLQCIEKKEFLVLREDIPSRKWNSFAQDVHGISWEKNAKEGQPRLRVFLEVLRSIKQCKYIVAHNIKFDWWQLETDLKALKLPIPDVEQLCTMIAGRKHIGKGGLKPLFNAMYPSKDFDSSFSHHDAMEDTRALACIFKKMMKKGMIELSKQGEFKY